MAANKLTTAERSALAKVNSPFFQRIKNQRYALIEKKTLQPDLFTEEDAQKLKELTVFVKQRVYDAHSKFRFAPQ